MKVDKNTPNFWLYMAWLDGVPVNEIGGCFEADDVAGYIKFNPRSPLGGYEDTEETRWGAVVIQTPEGAARHA